MWRAAGMKQSTRYDSHHVNALHADGVTVTAMEWPQMVLLPKFIPSKWCRNKGLARTLSPLTPPLTTSTPQPSHHYIFLYKCPSLGNWRFTSFTSHYAWNRTRNRMEPIFDFPSRTLNLIPYKLLPLTFSHPTLLPLLHSFHILSPHTHLTHNHYTPHPQPPHIQPHMHPHTPSPTYLQAPKPSCQSLRSFNTLVNLSAHSNLSLGSRKYETGSSKTVAS